MTTEAEQPRALRKNLERVNRKTKRQENQIDRLTRMVLLERLKDGDIDFSEGLDLLDNYRPEFTDDASFDQTFSLASVQSWLAARRTR